MSSLAELKARLFGIDIDCVTMSQAVARVQGWIAEGALDCKLIVTPNLDHVVRLQHDLSLREAYHDADLVVADGWPVVAASRLLRKPLPERVAGSDLVPHLFAASTTDQPLRVFLLGAMPGVAQRAATKIERRGPGVQVVGTDSPPFGFEKDPSENERILEIIRQTTPDLLVVGFGSPKQEIWLAKHRRSLACKVAVAAGATIDFLAGEQCRAPRWLQRMGMEWLYRMCREPKRLVRRYLHDALAFPAIFWNEWKSLRAAAR